MQADQYAKSNGGDHFHMFLARVTLGGHPYECNDKSATVAGHSKGQSVSSWKLLPEIEADTGLRYSSLLGTALARKEFVVFRGIQAYPEYLITYTRK